MKIYVLDLYSYDTYSYSGLSVYDSKYFISEQPAKDYATKEGLTVSDCVNNDNICTINCVTVRE